MEGGSGKKSSKNPQLQESAGSVRENNPQCTFPNFPRQPVGHFTLHKQFFLEGLPFNNTSAYSPKTRKLPSMLTPTRPALWEGRSAAGVHAEEPRVHVSVEDRYRVDCWPE